MTTTSRSRRSSSHRKGDANEQAILETAARLLMDTPLADVSIADLAAGAGISRSSFYFYFGSKDEVLMALVDRLTGDLEDVVKAMADGIADDPRAGITSGVEATVQLWRTHGQVLRAIGGAAASSAEVGAAWNATIQRFVDVNAEMIRAERERGAAADGPPPEELATALIWLNERCCQVGTDDTAPVLPDDDIVAVLTEIWLRTIYGTATV